MTDHVVTGVVVGTGQVHPDQQRPDDGVTMRRRLIPVAVALILLAGCAPGGGGSGHGNDSGGAGVPQAQAPANLETDPNTGAIPLPAASPTPLATLPDRMQGRWGITAVDCDPAQADIAKGLMVIAGDRLTFYESRGTAGHITRGTGGDIAADIAMSGEGQTWAEPTTLAVQGEGRTLLRQATGPHDRAGVYIYRRCPALPAGSTLQASSTRSGS